MDLSIKRRSCIEWIVLFVYISTPIIEMINSIILVSNHGESNLGKLFRGFIYVILLYIIAKYSDFKKIVYLFGLTGAILIVCIFNYLIVHNSQILMQNLFTVTKVLYPIYFITALISLYKRKIVKKELYELILKTYCWFIPFTLLIPRLLGIGFNQYEGDAGFKGLNYQMNDINIIIVCLSIICIDNLVRQKKYKYLSMFLMNFLCLMIMGTKTSIGFLLLIAIIYMVKYKTLKTKLTRIIVALFIIIFSFLIFGDYIVNVFSEYFSRLISGYVYTIQIQGGSLWDFLSSGRSVKFEGIISNYYSTSVGQRFINIFLGIGRFEDANTEFDLIDVFLRYGIFITVIITHYYIKIISKFRGVKGFFKYKFSYICILVFSFVAGHVLFSAYSGSFLALIATLLTIEGMEKLKEGESFGK